MKLSNKAAKVRLILFSALLALCVLWTAFIFSNSVDTAEESTEKSDTVYEIVNDVAQSLGATEEIPKSTIRQSAHFLEFAVLGTLWALALSALLAPAAQSALRPSLLICLISLPICAVIALIDEYIQTFSDGRVCDLADVLTDTAGSLCGIAAICALYFIYRAIARFVLASKTKQNV